MHARFSVRAWPRVCFFARGAVVLARSVSIPKSSLDCRDCAAVFCNGCCGHGLFVAVGCTRVFQYARGRGFAFLHVARLFWHEAYLYRKAHWIAAIVLLFFVMAAAGTGYSLPW